MSARIFGRHRFASRGRAMLVAPVLAAAVGGSLAFASPASAGKDWADLRACESGGDYTANTGNGYFGAYQFVLSTWQSLGYTGLPSDAPPAVQDQAAMELAAKAGFGQWPVCGKGMGPENLAPGTAGISAHSAPDAIQTNGAVVPASAPSTGYPMFTEALIHQVRDDVRSWQAQLNTHGYNIAVDGQYGPESAAAACDFQTRRGLDVDGVVGPLTWAETFDGGEG